MSFPASVRFAIYLLLFLLAPRFAFATEATALAPSPTPAEEAATPAPPAPERSATPSTAVASSVVKIFSTARYPSVYRPWTKQAPTEASGSGVVIDGKRILTNAHVVYYASEVEVQADQGGDKQSASIEFIAPGIDLAVLKLEDEKFFDAHRPLPMAKSLPDIQDAVMVYGYPTGGSGLSVTKGIVSRTDFIAYNSSIAGLRVQIDAAINPGNSGGPAVVNDKMVGLTFSLLEGSQNIGYIVPTEEIQLFLHDIADGRYDGKPTMYDALQTLDNSALRAFLKIPAGVEGIVVHQPYGTAADYPLKEWDLITRIGDAPVDNQGMIKLKNELRVRFAYLIQQMAKANKVALTILRAGQEMHVEAPLTLERDRVIPDLQGGYPSYFVYGPLVFSEATRQLILDYADGNKAADWMLDLSYDGNPLLARCGDRTGFPDERIVFVAAPFFPHKLAKGYSNPSQNVVKTVNGISIRNLAQLVTFLRDCKDEFVRIEFELHGGETEVFPREEMVAATEDILTDNGVRSQGSSDMMKIWTAKAAP